MFFESRTHMRRMKTKAYNNNPPHTYRNKALWLLIGNFSNQVCLAFFKSWSSVIKRSKVSTTPIALTSLHVQRGSQVEPRLYSSKKQLVSMNCCCGCCCWWRCRTCSWDWAISMQIKAIKFCCWLCMERARPVPWLTQPEAHWLVSADGKPCRRSRRQDPWFWNLLHNP